MTSANCIMLSPKSSPWESLQKEFEKSGFACHFAENQEDFIHLLEDKKRDIVLLNWDFYKKNENFWLNKWLWKSNRDLFGWILLHEQEEIELRSNESIAFGLYRSANIDIEPNNIITLANQLRENSETFGLEEVVGNWIDMDYHSDESVLETVRLFICRLLYNTCLKSMDVKDLGFAVYELLLNALEHGNKYDPTKSIKISYVLFENEIVIKIEDEGQGFLSEELVDPSADPKTYALERERQGKRPGGYGIKITKQFVDKINYSDKGNCLILTKRILADSLQH